MTTIEVSPGQIYCSTDDRRELLKLIPWLVVNYEKMELRGQKAITICDIIGDAPGPDLVKREGSK